MSAAKRSPAVADPRVPLTNLDKVLYPEAGFTKGQVIAYYRAIAPVKPVSLKRLPDGVEGLAFFEKRAPARRPTWVHSAPVSSSRHGTLDYVVVDNLQTLVWLANRAALEIHAYLFRAATEDLPTAVIFDLDPGPPAALAECLPLALELRDLLADLGLRSFPKTSGGKGLHLLVPIDGRGGFAASKAFALAVARILEQRHPQLVTTTMAKAGRQGKIFIDWSQNDHGKTTVCAYSLRARPMPTASAPLQWTEVERAVRSGHPEKLVFEAEALVARTARIGDPAAELLSLRQRLPAFGRG